MKNITTIFFDAGGVLFDSELRRVERIKRILSSKGFEEEAITKAIVAGENEYENIGSKWLSEWKDEEDFFDRYYDAIVQNLDTKDKYSLKKQLFHHTHYAVNCVLFTEVKMLLDDLLGKYKLGVISNAFPSMDWIFDLLDIRKYFNAITFSYEVGGRKPDLLIYQKALESLNVEASESIFIDDRIENIEKANELGFTGIHLDRKINDLSIIYRYLK